MKQGFDTAVFSIRPLLLLFLLSWGITGCQKNSVSEQKTELKDSVVVTPITSVLKPVTVAVNSGVGGYYLALPSNYNQTTQKYPLLVFIPGAGQFGDGAFDLPLLLKNGPAQLVDEKRFPGTFTVNGRTHSFIIFTPQTKGYPAVSTIADCIEYAKRTFRVDTTRIYLSGLSVGGVETTNVAAVMPGKLAAIVPMAGVFLDYSSTNKTRDIASAALPVWAFHSENDGSIDVSWARGFVSNLNSFSPLVRARLTVWPDGGHDAWTRALEPNYKENGMNIYEWMLQYQR
jgi:predicted peptidase